MNKSRGIGSSLLCAVLLCAVLLGAALLGVAGYSIWKFAGEPSTAEEAKEGLSDVANRIGDALVDLADAVKDKWKELDRDLGDFANVLDDLLDVDFGTLFDDDPRLGSNATVSWADGFVRPSEGGLHLTLRNALDETWQEEFRMAVEDWQKSDAMVLTTERVAVDHACQRVEGVQVVCNANFGGTGWVGINESQLIGGKIVSSVSKMNEYYLRNAEFAHRRFAMCHELGHGFGLPHTDENPYNSNLGDCLDYTDDPEENVLPGEVNMAKLRNMYLTQKRRRVLRDGTVVERTRLVRQ